MFKKRLKPLTANPVFICSSLLAIHTVLAGQSVLAQDIDGTSQQANTLDSEQAASVNDDKDDENKDAEKADILEEVLITGLRRNLQNAQEMKREADTMIDAVSAEQIGKLSDRSPVDVMQRMPGISTSRFAAPNDPDHFGLEESTIVIRGLSQNRSEFNGRDSFSAYSGRGLSYKDVSPELLSGIEIFKNQTADVVEGGIGGTVNLITRKPFDTEGRFIALSFDQSYGDLVEESSPTFSGLFSDTYKTAFGDFGVLFNYANSELSGLSHGIQSDAYLEYYARNLVTENNPNPVGTRAEDFLGDDIDGDGEPDGTVYVPSAANMMMKKDDRSREGIAAVLQFASNDKSVDATLEYIRSDAKLSWHERAIKYQGGFFSLGARSNAPLEGTHYTFDESGLFQSGVLVYDGDPWRTGPSGRNRVPSGYGGEFPQWGHRTQMDSRVNDTNSLVEDLTFHVNWLVSDRLNISGDVQYIEADAAVDDVSVHINTYAMFDYDVSGDLPHVRFIEPWNGVRDATRLNDAEADGLADNVWDAVDEDGEYEYPGFGGDPQGDQNYFQDEHNYYWRSAMDHYERSEGESFASRLDLEYDFDFGILSGLKAGYRFAEREQVVRATSWNWGALAPEWQGGQTNWEFEDENGEPIYEGSGIGWLTDITPLQDAYEYIDWSGLMGGGVVNIPGNQTIHAKESLVRSVMGANPSRRLYTSPVGDGNWDPYPTRENVDSEFGIFIPSEFNTTVETRNAFYVRLDFEGDGELPFSGNVGLRVLEMDREAAGIIDFPSIAPRGRSTQRAVPEGIDLPLNPEFVDNYVYGQIEAGNYGDYDNVLTDLNNNWLRNPYNYLPNDVRAFAMVSPRLDENGEQAIDGFTPIYDRHTEAQTAKFSYRTYLPSFNIKVELTPELVGRFALAKTVAFPDLGDVRNRTEFSSFDASTQTTGDDIVVINREVEVEGKTPVEMIESVQINRRGGSLDFVAEGGNPYMRPMESVQYDFSLEWYFSDFGQLSAAIFHKNLSNYFSQGVVVRNIRRADNGAAQNVAVTAPKNGGDAKLDGFEINYHQFFEGWFKDFGIQATYTFIDATSVPNNVINVQDEQWFNSIYEDTGIRVDPANLPLEGQSDHTVNLIAMYENDTISARLAYNWRSRYLLTTRDVISKAPQWYKDHGELDGSFIYSVSENFSVGIQAENLTNERSETVMILNNDLLSVGRSWFEMDRRVALVIRAEF